MASSLDYTQFVCEQMSGAGDITYRKMFGEYALYCNGKCFGLVCDNQVYLPPTSAGQRMLPNAPMGTPYDGAKPRILLEDLENREFLAELVAAISAELPEPKPKKKRSKPA